MDHKVKHKHIDKEKLLACVRAPCFLSSYSGISTTECTNVQVKQVINMP